MVEWFVVFYEIGWWVLVGLIVLYVVGVIKYMVIDRDGMLNCMVGFVYKVFELFYVEYCIIMYVLVVVVGLVIWGVIVLLVVFELVLVV